MSERRLQDSYDGISIVGGFDTLHTDHQTFLAQAIGSAASVASFDHVYIGVDPDEFMHQRKGLMSPLFSYDWRKEDLVRWSATVAVEQDIHIEKAVSAAKQPTNRLLVKSEQYSDSPSVRAAIDNGAHVLFVPPINRAHTSNTKDLLAGTEQNSSCAVLQVGAVVLRNGVPVSVGSNGGRLNDCNTCPKGIDIRERSAKAGVQLPSPINCIYDHAETKALKHAQQGDDLLVSVTPCLPCAEQIVETGIRRVVFMRDWIPGRPITKSVRYLKDFGSDRVRIRQAGHHPNSPNN